MKIVGKDKKITIADELQFIIETKDENNCLSDPYRIDNVTIYFVSREFTNPRVSEYEHKNYDEELLVDYEENKKIACNLHKTTVRVATTSNISLTGFQSIDGVSLQSGDRVLVKSQNNKTENGIYVVSDEIWVRSEDANNTNKIKKGMYVFVSEGLLGAETGWVLITKNPVILGSSEMNFLKFSVSGTSSVPFEANEVHEKLNKIKKELDSSEDKTSFFYKDSIPIKVFGGNTDSQGEFYPAWLNPNYVSSELKSKVQQDNILSRYEENNEIVEGKFQFSWLPHECREGDYFVCWKWRPNLSGDTRSAHLFFTLEGDTVLTTSIPTHYTKPEKYEILLERYLPEMFKTIISENDLTPAILKEFNNSVADGFKFLEDFVNQIIDLLDANSTHEQFLPLLSNLFNLKLKSNDPTLWRRQIKKAIPNFKTKGTVKSLKESLSDIGMKFLSINRLWQVVSKYTFQESFVFEESNTFDLSKNVILPIDENFKLWYRPNGTNQDWQNLNEIEEYIEFDNARLPVKLVWIGDGATSPISLSKGDSIRIIYKFREIASENEQSLETYIRSLPLMDNRDERDQLFPIKNWNVHLIEEDDPLFNVIIPVRHPFADPIIWGKIRTEFPYSENVYNMEEYNGSTRDSFDPCHIDKDFIDPCGQCQSSKFNLNIEVEKLSNESFFEAQKIVEEYMPFHAVVGTYNLSGAINEFIKPSEERIEALISYYKEDILIAGEAQHIFNRSMDSNLLENAKRDMLSEFEIVAESKSGLLKNDKIVLLPSGSNSESDINNADFKNKSQVFDQINIDTTYVDEDPYQSSNLFEILSPSINSGAYTISNFSKSSAEIVGSFAEPLSESLFEYRVSNKIADLNVDIEQSDKIIFNDDSYEFATSGVITQYDVDNNLSSDGVWHLKFEDKEYLIENIMPDGSLLLKYDSDISPITGWVLTDGTDDVYEKNSGGSKTTKHYGLIETNEELDVKNLLKIGDYVLLNGVQYLIKYFKFNENKFFIENYNNGTEVGADIKVYRRILKNKVGQLSYKGLILEANDEGGSYNLELNLPISNGINASSAVTIDNLKENYLIFIDSEYYTILEIDGNTVNLDGPFGSYMTSGTPIEFSVYKFIKSPKRIPERIEPATPGYNFEYIDRNGGRIITENYEYATSLYSSVLNAANSNQPIEIINQNESISFDIEYKKED